MTVRKMKDGSFVLTCSLLESEIIRFGLHKAKKDRNNLISDERKKASDMEKELEVIDE